MELSNFSGFEIEFLCSLERKLNLSESRREENG